MENRDSTIELPLENAGIEKAANEKKKSSILSRLKFVPVVFVGFCFWWHCRHVFPTANTAGIFQHNWT